MLMPTKSYQELIEADVKQVFPCSEAVIIERLRAAFEELNNVDDSKIKAAFARWFAELAYQIGDDPAFFINKYTGKHFWKHIPEPETNIVPDEQQIAA